MAAIYKLSSLLQCKASLLTFAGTKDKVAVTTQELTVKGIRADRSERCTHAHECTYTLLWSCDCHVI